MSATDAAAGRHARRRFGRKAESQGAQAAAPDTGQPKAGPETSLLPSYGGASFTAPPQPWDPAPAPGARHPADAEHEAVTGRPPGEVEATLAPLRTGPYITAPTPALVQADPAAPLAFLRRPRPDGGFGQYWPLSGAPRFLGLRRAGDRQVAEICLGEAPQGRPWIVAGDLEAVDARIRVLWQARDHLAAGAPQPVPEPKETAADVIQCAKVILARAQTLKPPEDEKAADEISGVVASLSHALDLHESVRSGKIPPEWVSAHLAAGDKDTALSQLAEDVALYLNEVVVTTERYRGAEVGAWLTGQEAATR